MGSLNETIEMFGHFKLVALTAVVLVLSHHANGSAAPKCARGNFPRKCYGVQFYLRKSSDGEDYLGVHLERNIIVEVDSNEVDEHEVKYENGFGRGILLHFSPCDYEGPDSSIKEGRWLQLCVCYGRSDEGHDECNKKRVVQDAKGNKKPLDHDDFPYDHHVWVYIGQKNPDRHEEFKAYILEEPRKSPLPGQYQEPEYDEY